MNFMIQRFTTLMGIVLISFIISGCWSAREVEIRQNELPEAVASSFSLSFPNAIVDDYKREIEDGSTIYEISFISDGMYQEVLYDVDGKQIELEILLPIEELPAHILETLKESFTDFTIHQVEKIHRAETTLFEVELYSEYHRKWFEVFFAENGKLIRREEL